MLSNDGRGICATKPDTGPFLIIQRYQPGKFLKNFLGFWHFEPLFSYKWVLMKKKECTLFRQFLLSSYYCLECEDTCRKAVLSCEVLTSPLLWPRCSHEYGDGSPWQWALHGLLQGHHRHHRHLLVHQQSHQIVGPHQNPLIETREGIFKRIIFFNNCRVGSLDHYFYW